TNSLLAAIAILATAGIASAQTTLKAEIPFAFQAGNTMMAPGSYQIFQYSTGVPTVRMRNHSENKTVLLLPQLGDAPKDWLKFGVPKISFECVDGNCSLAQIWTGSGREALQIHRHRARPNDNARVNIITIELKAE